MRRFRKEYGGSRLRFNTIKLFMDGVNENRTGALLEPYSDNLDYVGDTMLTVEELRDFLIELHNEEFDLHIHTIGDLAARRVLDGVEAAKEQVGKAFYPRVTVSHMELVDPADNPRFAELSSPSSSHSLGYCLLWPTSIPRNGLQQIARAICWSPTAIIWITSAIRC